MCPRPGATKLFLLITNAFFLHHLLLSIHKQRKLGQSENSNLFTVALFICSLLACISSAGVLAFAWWHITPYLLGNVLFLLSSYSLYIANHNPKTTFVTPSSINLWLLFLSFLFNEIFLVATFGYILLQYFLTNSPSRSRK